jgi:hypothetical protein
MPGSHVTFDANGRLHPASGGFMKRNLWQIVGLLGALLTASSTYPQSKGGNLVVNIPFSFRVANHTLPPGRYIVEHMGDHALRIFSARKQAVLVLTNRVERRSPVSSRKIVFHQYENAFFLSEVWDAPGSIGRSIPRPPKEVELAAKGAEQQVAVLQILEDPR